MKALPIFVAVLLVAVPALGAVSPASVANPSVQPATGETQLAAGNASSGSFTPRVLSLPRGETSRSEVSRQSVDLGQAVDFGVNATSMRLETDSTVERISSVEQPDQRQRLLLGALNRIEQQAITLSGDQRSAIEAYSDGRITARTLLVRLASVGARANALEERRTRLNELAEETEGFSYSSQRVESLRRELATLTGPVRTHAIRTIRGDVPPGRFYVATAPESVVLSTISERTYVREVYRGDLRNQDENRLSPQDAVNTTARSYPEIWQRKSDYTVLGAGDNYLVRVPYGTGSLSAFVDSGSGDVFKEYQRRSLNRSIVNETRSKTQNGLELTVSRSYPGSPLYVNLTDADTGDPVEANVTIGPAENDSTLIGRTDADGELWTVAPDYRFTIFAIKGNSFVFVTVEPTAPPRAGLANGDGEATDDNRTTAVTADSPPSQ
jgi:hypothetical protein